MPILRETLPDRRAATNLNLEHAGMRYILTFSKFADGRIAEIFLNTEMKSGSMLDVCVHDGAVLVSLALQHGTPIDVMQAAIKRDSNGSPSSPIGAAIDMIMKE